jgi:hypothetical protein
MLAVFVLSEIKRHINKIQQNIILVSLFLDVYIQPLSVM